MSQTRAIIAAPSKTRVSRQALATAKLVLNAMNGEELPDAPPPRRRRKLPAAGFKQGDVVTLKLPPVGRKTGEILYRAGYVLRNPLRSDANGKTVRLGLLGSLAATDGKKAADDDGDGLDEFRQPTLPVKSLRRATSDELAAYVKRLNEAWDALNALVPGKAYTVLRAVPLSGHTVQAGTRVVYVPFWADAAMAGIAQQAARPKRWMTDGGNLQAEAYTFPGARVLDVYHQMEFLCDPANLVPVAYADGMWDRLVLPDEDKARLLSAIHREAEGHDRVYEEWNLRSQHKGRGFILLCQGPPGVGKTMTAEAIASFLRRPMLTVQAWANRDEAFLERVFSLAAKWRMVVLLDEAETFLCHRAPGEMMSNALVATMLRRLEAFDGVAVLTTNREFEIDPAALSRMHMVLRFKAPDERLRERIWRQSVPAAMPLGGDLDVALAEGLARMELDGRQIVHAVLQAASRTAHEGREAVPVEYLRDAATQVLADQKRTQEMAAGFRTGGGR